MMNQREAARQAPGLCGRCVHAAWIRNDRGSEFLRCGRSDSDPRYVKFPLLPVLICAGYETGGPKPDAKVR